MSTLSVRNLQIAGPHSAPVRKGDNGEYTVYVDAKSFRHQIVAERQQVDDELSISKSIDFQGKIELTGEGKEFPRTVTGRGHAALCFGEQLFSVTLRGIGIGKVEIDNSKLENCLPAEPYYRSSEVLFDAITSSQPASRKRIGKGLVLIAGGTGSGKTDCLTQLLSLHIKELFKQEHGKMSSRLPHIVAIGDPVEGLFFRGKGNTIDGSAEVLREMLDRPFDYTARILGADVASIGAALKDALRETPEAVIAGELRSEEDFRATLDFAATGHLIFATCHSRSLVEVFSQLLKVMGSSRSASDRAALVHRLAAIVHIEKLGEDTRVPVVWRPSVRGQQDFVSEGLSSIIPASPLKADKDKGVLGRYWVLKELIGIATELEKAGKESDPMKRELLEACLPDALAKDLKGE